jgi:hypothetical protein
MGIGDEILGSRGLWADRNNKGEERKEDCFHRSNPSTTLSEGQGSGVFSGLVFD